jgi:hypothetical protein
MKMPNMRNRYYLPLTTAVLGMLSAVAVAASGGLLGVEMGVNAGRERILTAKLSDVFDVVHELRVGFAADHGVANPSALVASVRHSPMANLLISVAIEESRGDPVAVGSSGEQGAWQVKASSWGAVPEDLHGQAGQAERIICALLNRTKGDKIEALARYNGGTTPPGRSYRYAERVLKRARYLQVAINFFPPVMSKARRI